MVGLDFKTPVGVETFNCFKKVCIIERNMNECSRSDPVPKDTQVAMMKKVRKSKSWIALGMNLNPLFMQPQLLLRNLETLLQD